jgi:hypothetical protein
VLGKKAVERERMEGSRVEIPRENQSSLLAFFSDL